MKAEQLDATINDLVETRTAVQEVKERLKKHTEVYGEKSLIPARTTFMVGELEINLTTIIDALKSARDALFKTKE